MRKTLLKFSSYQYLTAFRRFSKSKFWEIDLATLTVLCDCTQPELHSACNHFSAQVIADKPSIEVSRKLEPVPGAY